MMKNIFLLSLLVLVLTSSPMAQSPVHPKIVNNDVISTPDQGSMINILRSIDIGILKTNNEVLIAEHLQRKNQEIIHYIQKKYPQYGAVDAIDAADNATTLLGYVYAAYEATGFRPILGTANKQAQNLPTWLSCTLEVLGAATGITEAISSLGTFSTATVWKVVKTVVRKYAVGWFGTAVALIQVANNCF